MWWYLIAAIWILDYLGIRLIMRMRLSRAKRAEWEATHPGVKWDDWKHVVR